MEVKEWGSCRKVKRWIDTFFFSETVRSAGPGRNRAGRNGVEKAKGPAYDAPRFGCRRPDAIKWTLVTGTF